MSIVKNVSRLAPSVRHLTTSTAVRSAVPKAEIHPGFKELKTVQAKYQQHDGKPVHLKRGLSDQILYRLTMAGCLVGLGNIFKLFYDLS